MNSDLPRYKWPVKKYENLKASAFSQAFVLRTYEGTLEEQIRFIEKCFSSVIPIARINP